MNSVSPGTVANRPSAPIGLRLFDALFRTGDEIPPEMPRPVHRLAAQRKQPSGPNRAHCDRSGRTKDEQPARFEDFASDLDGTLGDIDRTLLVIGWQFQPSAAIERCVGIKHVRKHGERRARAIELAAIRRTRLPSPSTIGNSPSA